MAENLDDLLDNALADFEDNSSSCDSDSKAKNQAHGNSNKATTKGKPNNPEDIFNQMFDPSMAGNLQKEWMSAMDELKTEDPELAEQLKNTIFTTPENNQSEDVDPTPASLNDTLTATIAGVNQSAEGAKNTDLTPDELFSQMQGLNLGGDGMEDNFFSMMENMMKSLLAKDVLYPSMKELASSYEPWLNKNKDTLPKTDFNRYAKQNEVIKSICSEYSNETSSDSEEVKSTRFKVIMGLVQQMQQHGDPPEDLMKECADSESLQNVFGGPNPFPGMTEKPEDLIKDKDDCIIM